jgi:P22 coat protein - gene protein 5
VPNNLANFVPQIWSRRIIANINQINVAMSVMTNSNYQGEIQAAGDTVQVRTFGSVTVQDYNRGQPISAEALQPVKETLTINNSKYFAFDVDSLDVAQNDINAIEGYTQRAGVAMANAIDTFIMGYGLNGNSANTIGTAGSPIALTKDTDTTSAYQQLVYAGRQLDKLNVPTDSRWVIVTPFFKSLMLQSTNYFLRSTDMGDTLVRSAQLTASDATRVGFFGQAAGFDCYMSANTPTNGTYWANIYGQGKRVCYAAQIPPSTMEAIRLENTFATRVRGLLLQGAQVFAEDSKALGVIYTTNA